MSRPGLPERWLPLVATAAGLLVWGNLVVPRLPADTGVRAVANLAATLALVLAARAGGLGWPELGIGRTTWRAGLRWGAAVFAALTAGYGAALLLPGARSLLADPRVEGVSSGPLLVRALLLIPLGTVL